MPEKLIPADAALAARRGFLRTTMQGYEAVLAVGVSANAIVSLVRGEVDVLVLGVTVGVALLAPPLAGLRSWLSISRRGIPAEYAEKPTEESPVEGES